MARPQFQYRIALAISNEQVFPRFRDEYDAPPHVATGDPNEHFFDMGPFGGTDVLALYCMIRHFQPTLVLEIGSGVSSLISAKAALKNGNTQLVCVEPYPNERLRSGFPGLTRLISTRVQELALDFFDQLGRGDVLFIDSSHVAELFPEAKFIHIIRDGRDVVSSLIRKRHADGRPWTDWETSHYVWLSHVSIGCEFGETLPTSQYFQLRYEDLIADDVGFGRKPFRFLDIPLHPAVVRFCEDQVVARTAFSGPTRDLTAGASGSDWAKLVSPADQLQSLDILSPLLIRHGYATESSLAADRERLAELASSPT